MNSKIRFRSLLAIGNPIVDISAEVTREILDKYHLKFGETVFANKNNVGFYQELENNLPVSGQNNSHYSFFAEDYRTEGLF